MTALPSSKKQHQLKLLMLWLAIAFGHLNHTGSHYLRIELSHAESAHEGDADNEHSEESEHNDAGTCVTCIASAMIFLELGRSVDQALRPILPNASIPSFLRTINLGMEIALRPGQARAPPFAA